MNSPSLTCGCYKAHIPGIKSFIFLKSGDPLVDLQDGDFLFTRQNILPYQ
jgi:hypothetical protein